MTPEAAKILIHIARARHQYYEHEDNREAASFYANMTEMLTYAVNDDIECLRQFDYMLTDAEYREEWGE